VFRDQEFSSDLGSRAVNRINNVRTMRGLQFAEDASPMAHPIRPDSVIEMNNFYTLTVYEKGAEVIRMLHTLLGEENFQKGMQLYFERHDGSAATCDDLSRRWKMPLTSICPISAAGTASPVRRLSPSMTTTTRKPSSTR
jgi:aminopeptidase N